MITPIVVRQGANVPCICAVVSPGTLGFRGFINDSFAPRGGKEETVPVIWSVYCFIRQHCGVDARGAQHVKFVLYLRSELIPQLQWEVAVGGSKGTNEVCLEHLDGALSCVHPVIVGFNEKVIALLCGEILFDYFACLVIHHIHFNFVSL